MVTRPGRLMAVVALASDSLRLDFQSKMELLQVAEQGSEMCTGIYKSSGTSSSMPVVLGNDCLQSQA